MLLLCASPCVKFNVLNNDFVGDTSLRIFKECFAIVIKEVLGHVRTSAWAGAFARSPVSRSGSRYGVHVLDLEKNEQDRLHVSTSAVRLWSQLRTTARVPRSLTRYGTWPGYLGESACGRCPVTLVRNSVSSLKQLDEWGPTGD